MSSVLVVDDDPALARSLEITFRARGYQAASVHDGAAALHLLAQLVPDVVILDLGLPDLDGLEVLQRLRSWSTVPVIVMSARSSATDKTAAMDAGADDYLTKPFKMAELLAQIRAAVRRSAPIPGNHSSFVSTPDFTVELDSRQVVRAGQPVRLIPTEWALLEILVRHRGKVVSTHELLADIWDSGELSEAHYLRACMAQLRRKLEPQPTRPTYFITEPNVGYRFQAQPTEGPVD